MDKWNKLQTIHLDVLKEIGNIGVGNAATSLSNLIGESIEMGVPRAAVSHINQLVDFVGNEEDEVVCISLEVTSGAPSNVFFILKRGSALELFDKVMGYAPGTYAAVDENCQSALLEIGNILTGAILNAMSSMTGITMKQTVPAFAHDMLGAVLSAALLERGYNDDKALIIETRFHDKETVIDGYFFMLPQFNSLQKIFQAVGVEL